MKPILVVRVTSDNFFNQLFTIDAYEELCLQMSTGDFHTHMHDLTRSISLENVITLGQMLTEQNELRMR